MANFFRPSKRTIDIPPVAVIGLGRFGSSLAHELIDHGVEVLGIDIVDKAAREQSALLSDVILADATDKEALMQLGIDELQRVVVAIGSHLEASILTTSNLVEIGVKDIWAKADSDAHARILSQLGVHHVIRPERDTGRRVAHLLGGKFQDFAEITQNYGVSKLAAPACVLDQPINLDRVWRVFRVQLVSRGTNQGTWEPIVDTAVLGAGDIIVAAGSPEDLEAFSEAA